MKYTFETALVYLKQGKKVRRVGWIHEEGFEELYLFIDFSNGKGRFAYGEFDRTQVWYALHLEAEDVLAEDWEVVE